MPISLCEEFGIAKVFLFGSYARVEANLGNDVDILIEKRRAKGIEVFDFQDLLSERLDKPVDIATTEGASDRFLSKIRCDEVLLYDAVLGNFISNPVYKSNS